ncbi:hypothetical protein [Paraburkholderia kirstenboschensis]|uniref:hypothetical protein n=1 Tax=Paraburkholderia kirstenboschensis TaxID=1245436 RepID=UPI0013E30888|nr:hypothetical protein [Paraburkholderia kirstenboschensis]
MPDATNRRTAKRPTHAAPVAPVAVPEEREPRGACPKRETRARLLDAALTLRDEKGMWA